MKVEGHKVELGTSPHSDQDGYGAHLFASFGTASGPFLDGAITQLLKASAARGKVATEREANAGLAFVSAVGPTNELECSMALQMHATNELALELLNRAHHASDRGATVEYTNLATKLTRTFVTQVEALAKLRRNGEQVVKHVHVYDGGQAVVVGTINQGGKLENGTDHLMQKRPMHLSPRCLARTRRSTPCQSPAMPNGRCRMHGGKSTGAPKGSQNAWKHGLRSGEHLKLRALVRALMTDC
jgi:hypothetical protein